MMARPSSMRSIRSVRSCLSPKASKSGWSSPAPRPSTSRPSLTRSSEAAACTTSCGRRRATATTEVMRRRRSVRGDRGEGHEEVGRDRPHRQTQAVPHADAVPVGGFRRPRETDDGPWVSQRAERRRCRWRSGSRSPAYARRSATWWCRRAPRRQAGRPAPGGPRYARRAGSGTEGGPGSSALRCYLGQWRFVLGGASAPTCGRSSRCLHRLPTPRPSVSSRSPRPCS